MLIRVRKILYIFFKVYDNKANSGNFEIIMMFVK